MKIENNVNICCICNKRVLKSCIFLHKHILFFLHVIKFYEVKGGGFGCFIIIQFNKFENNTKIDWVKGVSSRILVQHTRNMCCYVFKRLKLTTRVL